MSDDSNDIPFNFPHSEHDYYPELDEQQESAAPWEPESLQMMQDHGFSPEDFEDVSVSEEEPEGEFVHYLSLTRTS